MTKTEFLRNLDELLELEPGTIMGGEALADLERWDSVTILGFMALMDEEFGIAVSPARLAQCKTVQDLVALAGDKIEG